MANPQNGTPNQNNQPGQNNQAGQNQAGKPADKAAEAGRHAADKAAEVARTATREATEVAQLAAKTVQDTVKSGFSTAAQVTERSTTRLNQALDVSERQADDAAEAGQRVARAGAEIARRGSETTQAAVQSGLDMAAKATERSVNQFAEVFGFSGEKAEETSRQSSRTIGALAESSTVLAQGFQTISREFMTFAQDRAQKNAEGISALMGARTLQDVLTIQSNLMRDNLEHALAGGRRFAELSAQVSGDAGRKVTESAEQGQPARQVA